MYFFSRNKLKKAIKHVVYTFLFVLLTLPTSIFGAEVGSGNLITDSIIESCGDMNFSVEGSFFVKPEQRALYTVKTNSILDQQASVEYELRQEDKLIEVGKEHQFTYLFTDLGTYTLKTILRRSESCIQSSEQSITVAKQIWLGIWLNEQNNEFLFQSVRNQGVAFIFLPSAWDQLSEESTIKRVQQIAKLLPSSDVLFVEESQARLLFDHLDDIRTYGIWFPERIILAGNISTSALRRLLHQSPMITNFSEIAVTPKPYVSSVVQHLLNEQSLQQLAVVRLVHPQNTPARRRQPFSWATDYLLTYGMSINFVLFLLCTPVIALCLVFLKQVIWFNVWGIYYILLAVAANIFVGRQIALLMFVAALIGQILAHLITKKIYLLYAPKVWLTITLTCISFMVMSIRLSARWYTVSLPTDPIYVFFPLLVFSSMMQYIYPQHNSLFKIDRRLWFLQFIGWVVGMSFLIQRPRLQQFVLWYPDSILIVLVAMIYIWRFAGLQVSEYIRFWPLISKHLSEEE